MRAAAKETGDERSDLPNQLWPRIIVEMAEVLEAFFMRRGRPERDAQLLARDAIVELSAYMGGRQMYLPRGDRLKTAFRDRDIYRRLGSEKASSLAAEFGLTETHVYRIARAQRALGRARREKAEAEQMGTSQ